MASMAGKGGHQKSTTGGQYSFAQVPTVQMQRSVFDRSCGVKTAFDAGKLIPIFVDEALPGDSISMAITNQARLATVFRPIMDNIYIETHWFAVPNRLLWTNWERFQGAQDDPTDSTSFVIPIVDSGSSGGHAEESLYDYMGIPPGIEDLETNALFTRAYNLIWNEWFRDQNLQDSAVVDLDNGPDTASDYVIKPRQKRHDYFTSCLPWPQKGDAVTLPLGTSAPLIFGTTHSVQGGTGGLPTGGTPLFDIAAESPINLKSHATTASAEWSVNPATGAANADWDDPELVVVPGNSYADLSAATAATINAIRQAFQVQKIYERDARGGTRYVEQIKAHWGVTSPDFRHQRPEYLGGSKQVMDITPVAQTSKNDGGTGAYVGELGGFGQGVHGSHLFTKSFTEHCVIIGLVSARADLNYQQGLERQWSRQTRFDFYIPALANIGEQAVLNKEIWADGSANDDLTFGYQERWAEYRYKPSLCTGTFRSSAAVSLDVWHVAQDFATLPVLDSTFIQENPPIDRVIQIPSEPHFLFDCFMSFRHARPMPTYSVPGKMDHF